MLRSSHAVLATLCVVSLFVPSSTAGRGNGQAPAMFSRGSSRDGSSGITIVSRTIRPVAAAEASGPQFKYGKLAIVNSGTFDKVKSLFPNTDYDALGIVAFPAAGTYPYVDQWEIGKAAGFEWDAGDIIIPADGLYEIRTTFNVNVSLSGEKLSFAEVFGANRTKTTKFKIQ